MNNKLFVYGILKRGYNLSLDNYGAKFIGEASIQGAVLYGIGYLGEVEDPKVSSWRGVGLKLDKDPYKVAYGELWEVPGSLWRWLDDIEQNGRVYERKIVPITQQKTKRWQGKYIGYDVEYPTVDAWVYEHMHEGFTEDQLIEGGRF